MEPTHQFFYLLSNKTKTLFLFFIYLKKRVKRYYLNMIKNVLLEEFDSGSGLTLAACLTHASRTERK